MMHEAGRMLHVAYSPHGPSGVSAAPCSLIRGVPLDSFQSRKLPPMKERDITVEGLLGCTYDDYERYLCRWPIWRPDNYDKDIDHIIPIRYYDLADPIDLKRVWVRR